MENKEKNFVSAVIYIHNAGKWGGLFLKTVLEVLEENFEHSEIICVNDCSDDGSMEDIKDVCKQASATSVSVIHLSYFHGLEAAMNAGVDLAIGDFVFEFDGTEPDFDKSEIMKVYRHALANGCDIVSAVPERREKLSSRLFYFVFDRFTNQPYEMHTERFRVLTRRVINRVSSVNKTIPYRKAVYANQGLKTDYIMYRPTGLETGHADKQEKGYRRELAVDSLILFTELGYRFSVWMTGFMMVLSLFMVLYSVVVFAAAHPVAGWTTTILFLSVAFFGLFGILTIIIKYLQLLVNLQFKRKHYSYSEIEKLT